MSYYTKDMYEFAFATRTAYNLKYIEEEVQRRKLAGETEDQYRLYEVTQLLNSFVGVLVLPKEKTIKNLLDTIEFSSGSEAAKSLNSINLNREQNYNTYLVKTSDNRLRRRKPGDSLFTAAELVRHLRNAIAHGNFSVYPEKPGEGNEIQYLRFEDSHKLYGTIDRYGYYTKGPAGKDYPYVLERRAITLSVDEVRALVFSICKLLLQNFPGGTENWPKDLPY